MSRAARPPGRRPAPSLRAVSQVAAATVAALTLVGIVVGVTAVTSLSDARASLVDQIDPATVEAAELHAAALVQQTGLRGYALSGDPDFLAEFRAGGEDAARLLAALEDRVEPLPAIAPDVADVATALGRWQDEHAARVIASVDAGAADVGAVTVGSDPFPAVRAALEDLRRELAAERVAARAELRSSARELSLTLVLGAALLVAVVGSVWVAVRRSVIRPLFAVVEDARTIAGGEVDHHVEPVDGPAEFVELAAAVETMRVELLRQLRAVEAREADLTRSNAELEQFAYVASHDLQEPLRKVASFTQMLERRYKGQLDDRADQYIAFAVDGAKRMQELINDLLSFSRVGRTTERFVEVSGEDVLDRALENLDAAITDSGATVHRSPMPELVGDRALLVALFQNLIGNAIKFRGADPPVVSVTAREVDDLVEVTVVDNGIGIPSEYRERIFVIFQRLHSRAEYEGTGIGLALSRKIVEFHGGTIAVEDRPGPGTTITFTLSRRLPPGGGAPTTTQEAVPA